MKSKKLITAVGLGLGITIFTGAALASYSASSGYDVGKKAAKGLLENENYTFDTSVKLTLDGTELINAEIRELYDRNGDVKLNRVEKYTGVEAYGNNNAEFAEYRQGGDRITVYDNGDGSGERANVYHNATDYMGGGALDSMNTTNENDRETINKIVRFAELAADTFVGDLKNNVVYVSGGDNGASYEMNLDSIQIPELVNAGISAMFSAMSQNGNENDPFLILGSDPIVKSVSLKFSVDSEGRLTALSADAVLTGNGHEMAVDIDMSVYDYGTTKPVSVDISTLTIVREINCDEDDSGVHTYSVSVDEEAEENGYRVDENGNILNEDDSVVGHVEIDPETGEGTVVID